MRRQQRTIQWPVASERVTHHHKMQSIVRESPSSGRVLGITATHDGRTVNIRANKASWWPPAAAPAT